LLAQKITALYLRHFIIDTTLVTEAVTEDASEPVSLPTVPPEGSILRMLALTESSLIIYLDGHEPREYKLNTGLEQSW
jgi:hypothetical protein